MSMSRGVSICRWPLAPIKAIRTKRFLSRKSSQSVKPGSVRIAADPPLDLSKTFDTLDSSSIKTMQKILSILSDAEEQSEEIKHGRTLSNDIQTFDSEYLNDFTSKLGMELFEYKVIKFFNEKDILVDNDEIFKGFPDSYNNLLLRFVNDYKLMSNSFFKRPEITSNNTLNQYQSIAKFFIEKDSICLRRLTTDIKFLAKNIIEYSPSSKIYRFPNIQIPPPLPYQTSSPFTIMKSFSMKNNELNLLPFIIYDPTIIHELITKYQIHNRFDTTSPGLILKLMKSQEIEGERIFSILSKKILYKHGNLNDQFILENFINNNSIKAVISSQSKIPSRLLSFKKYKYSILKSPRLLNLSDNEVILILSSQFNRYFSIFYSINPLDCEIWLANLILAYNNNKNMIDDKLINDSIKYFREVSNNSQMDINRLRWNRLLYREESKN